MQPLAERHCRRKKGLLDSLLIRSNDEGHLSPEVWREEPGLTLVKRKAGRVVRLRMKSHGRRHRPLFSQFCAMDFAHWGVTRRRSRNWVITTRWSAADPKTQTVLNVSRLRYWLSVGAQPSHKVAGALEQIWREETRARASRGRSRRKSPRPGGGPGGRVRRAACCAATRWASSPR